MSWIHVEFPLLILFPHVDVEASTIKKTCKITFVKQRECAYLYFGFRRGFIGINLHHHDHASHIWHGYEFKHLLFEEGKFIGTWDGALPELFINLHVVSNWTLWWW